MDMGLNMRSLRGMKGRLVVATLTLSVICYMRRDKAEKDVIQFKNRKILETEDNVPDHLTQGISVNHGWLESFIAADTYKGADKEACNVTKEQSNMIPKKVFSDKQFKNGAFILYIIGILYMFYAIAIVCDNYFVPSLDIMIERFNIAPDVAGATLMAAGGSSPELFTSVMGVFITKSDVGIGTIVGSAVFNVLFVIAACAFASKKALSLTAYPLVRDTFFYSVALGGLVGFFSDEVIDLFEALGLFGWYILYVVYMKFNTFFEGHFYRMFPGLKKEDAGDVSFPAGFKGLPRKKLLLQMSDHVNARNAGDLEMDLVGQTGLRGLKKALSMNEKRGREFKEEDEIKNHYKQPEDKTVEDDDYENPVTAGLKGNIFNKILCLLTMPLTIPMFLTVPDPNNEKMKKFFPLSFIGSLAWIIVFSYLMVWWADDLGGYLDISDATMGITILAAGTSVPDLITSVIVARAGHGDMAVSSSIGSNIFDVTVGMPLPWILYTAWYYPTGVVVSSAGMVCSIGMLFIMLVAIFFAILLFRWRMTKPMGVLMMCLYACFLSVAVSLSECAFDCPF